MVWGLILLTLALYELTWPKRKSLRWFSKWCGCSACVSPKPTVKVKEVPPCEVHHWFTYRCNLCGLNHCRCYWRTKIPKPTVAELSDRVKILELAEKHVQAKKRKPNPWIGTLGKFSLPQTGIYDTDAGILYTKEYDPKRNRVILKAQTSISDKDIVFDKDALNKGTAELEKELRKQWEAEVGGRWVTFPPVASEWK